MMRKKKTSPLCYGAGSCLVLLQVPTHFANLRMGHSFKFLHMKRLNKDRILDLISGLESENVEGAEYQVTPHQRI
jgi:hypothetical protein